MTLKSVTKREYGQNVSAKYAPLFGWFEWTPSRRKVVGIPLGIWPHVREQNKHSYFPKPGQS